MKKLTIALLCSIGFSCIVTAAFAQNCCNLEDDEDETFYVYEGCKWPCYIEKGIDLEAECKSPWCAKRKYTHRDENEKYSGFWSQ